MGGLGREECWRKEEREGRREGGIERKEEEIGRAHV